VYVLFIVLTVVSMYRQREENRIYQKFYLKTSKNEFKRILIIIIINMSM